MATTVSLSPPLSPLLRRTNLKATSLKPFTKNPNLSLSFTRPTLSKPRFISPVRVSHADSGWEKRSLRFRNRLLDLTRLGSVVETAAESFFKSEIRRRLAVTAALIVLSRVGHFIPLPGFDRRLIPNSYLSFASGAVENLGDFTAEMKLSLFQLGISHQISASILMQVLCHIIPSLVKLRKEGLDGQEKIKSYIWWSSLGFAIFAAVVVSYTSLRYSIYAASHNCRSNGRIMDMWCNFRSWICLCWHYTETLYKLSFQVINCWRYILGVVGIFTAVTMWAVLVTEGCRNIKLRYYTFKLASSTRNERTPVTEAEPYIPFNINPTGMQPVLTTTYLLAFPSIMARLTFFFLVNSIGC
ncbi:hypothetical protein LUZ63_012336 [Rhynchospora breviuscula]|uniref:Preprotein translocase subunit SCY2, chloroplastic n=1 Tax=Rhynchospora breviuscula TaxID=2022672 RepID=A0A9Q0HRV4_9POAL|nr:hypothetical protein LUZ63_012336 [Rhynchospora breviuscula]